MSAGSGSREMLGENDTPMSKCFSTYEWGENIVPSGDNQEPRQLRTAEQGIVKWSVSVTHTHPHPGPAQSEKKKPHITAQVYKLPREGPVLINKMAIVTALRTSNFLKANIWGYILSQAY